LFSKFALIREIRVKTFFFSPFIFTLPENNTFSPNGVRRQAVRSETVMSKVENHQCLLDRGGIGGAVLRDGENHPKTGFLKKQNFRTP